MSGPMMAAMMGGGGLLLLLLFAVLSLSPAALLKCLRGPQ